MEKVQRVVVGGVLIREGRALIIRRSPNEAILPGVWELPSGKVDFGEDPSAALAREYKEETDLDVQPVLPFSVFHYCVTKQDSLRHTIQINYIVRATADGRVKLSTAHAEARWIAQRELSLAGIDGLLRDILARAFVLKDVQI